MFPLGCACAHTGREMSAHKKTWSAHKFSFKKISLHIFYTWRSKNRRALVKCCTRKILCTQTDFKKLKGALMFTRMDISTQNFLHKDTSSYSHRLGRLIAWRTWSSTKFKQIHYRRGANARGQRKTKKSCDYKTAVFILSKHG